MAENNNRLRDVYRFERKPWDQRWFLFLLCGLLVAIDYLAVPYQVFPFVFVFPVMLVAWNWGFWRAAVYATILTSTRYAYHFILHERQLEGDELFNVVARVAVLVLLAWLVAIIAGLTRQLRHRVRQLEGMLPICASCKAIRDDRGNWTRLESYITNHSAASFTHGLCPDCVKKLYGDVMSNVPHDGL